ncbi:MAG: site-specific recombinase XerD [Parvicella sp.]|jgi:site-specific recombinase XerD
MKTIESYLQMQGKSKSTIAHYKSYVLDFISFLDQDKTEVEQTTTKEVLAYLDRLKKRGQANNTRGFRLTAINHYFDWLIHREIVLEHPSKKIKIQGTKTVKLYSIFSVQELQQLEASYLVPKDDDARKNMNWFKEYQLSRKRNKVVISLMINQGLTTSQVAQITTKNLDLRAGTIFIESTRKSNARSLELKPFQIMDLMEYTLQTRQILLQIKADKTTEKLFLSTSKYDKLDIWKRLTLDLKKENKKFVNFKQVRASIITDWLKHYNLRKVQYMAGHRFVSSTESYLVNHFEDLQADIEKMHPLEM